MLTKEIAQKIVDKMMDVVPYNINIMDRKGVIIGSGEGERIGKMHQGALEAISNKSEVENYSEEVNVKPGINTPIIFMGEIAGVIGITGNPDVVRQFSKIVKTTAELLISEQYSLKNYMMKEKVKEEYIYEWLYIKERYSTEFIIRGESIGINTNKERRIIVIQYEEVNLKSIRYAISSVLHCDEYFINISPKRIVVILYNNKIMDRLESLKNKLNDINILIGVGNANTIINKSLIESLEALEVGSSLYQEENLFYYEKVSFFHGWEEKINKKQVESIIDMIEGDGYKEELIETLLSFIELNGEKNVIADKLHIHRNTLNYRLNKIEEITEKSFNNYMDLYQYISLYILFKLKKINCANDQKK